MAELNTKQVTLVKGETFELTGSEAYFIDINGGESNFLILLEFWGEYVTLGEITSGISISYVSANKYKISSNVDKVFLRIKQIH